MNEPPADRKPRVVSVAVVGPPVRVECTLRLEAVGADWDGTYQPVNTLTDTPPARG